VLNFLVNAQSYQFDGPDWAKKKKVRHYSTGFSSPINYGPALRSLGWTERSLADPEIYVPCKGAKEALDAFEGQITDRLDHPAFSKLGSVEVKRSDVEKWADGWALDSPTKAEM